MVCCHTGLHHHTRWVMFQLHCAIQNLVNQNTTVVKCTAINYTLIGKENIWEEAGMWKVAQQCTMHPGIDLC